MILIRYKGLNLLLILYREEVQLPLQVHLHILLVIFGLCLIGSTTLAFIVGIILGVLCERKCRQKKIISKQNIHISEENVMRSMKGPVYEEVELEDKTTTIDLSQNIAYEHVKKTVS